MKSEEMIKLIFRIAVTFGRKGEGCDWTKHLRGMVYVLLLNLGFWYLGILVLIVAITDYHKFSSLKQHQFTILQISSSEIWNGSYGTKIKMLPELRSF